MRGPGFRLYRNIAGSPNFKAAFLSSGSLFGCGPGELAIRSNPFGPGRNRFGLCTCPGPIAGPGRYCSCRQCPYPGSGVPACIAPSGDGSFPGMKGSLKSGNLSGGLADFC